MSLSDNRESRLDDFGHWEWVVIVLIVFAAALFTYGHQNRVISDQQAKLERCVK